MNWIRARNRVLWRLGRAGPVGRVAFNMRPVAGPWGGASAFVGQMAALLESQGWEVRYDLARPVSVIVLIDPREDLQHKAFGLEAIARHRAANPAARVLHRVNECDQRKDTHFMDAALQQANRIADRTVFISAWLRDYFAARWFDVRRPHDVIYNGADPRCFHPLHGARYRPGQPLRIVTHHWSDNPLKGFAVYGEVDAAIAAGRLADAELWVIGRWPADQRWRAARTFAPQGGAALGNLLRQCHVYLTASRWEPCGMHHVEGAQCGLPLVYHEDGGGIVEAGLRYGIGFRQDPVAALELARARYDALRAAVLAQMPSGLEMCVSYLRVIQQLATEA